MPDMPAGASAPVRKRLLRRPRAHRFVACLTVVAVAAPVVIAAPAWADSAEEARKAAAAAAAQVDKLRPEIDAAQSEYAAAVASVGTVVTRTVAADRTADDLELRRRDQETQQRQRIRTVYMAGGMAGVWGTVLAATDAQDALNRVDAARRVMSADVSTSVEFADAAKQARAEAQASDALAESVVQRADDVEQAFAELLQVLSAAEAELAALDATARRLEAAEAAAKALEEARAQAQAAALARARQASAGQVPADYFSLYRAAAATCTGLPWTVVAAIGQVETGHGSNVAVSSAGAQGPMQFMPRTFAAYGVDGDGDGDIDIWDPADSVFSAANYLCANGAGTPRKLRGAIWRYNHADWYVEMVLRIAGQLAQRAGEAPPLAP